VKTVLVEASLLFLAAVVVMAVVFRSKTARDILLFARNVLWAYVAMIILLAAVEVWQNGF